MRKAIDCRTHVEYRYRLMHGRERSGYKTAAHGAYGYYNTNVCYIIIIVIIIVIIIIVIIIVIMILTNYACVTFIMFARPRGVSTCETGPPPALRRETEVVKPPGRRNDN